MNKSKQPYKNNEPFSPGRDSETFKNEVLRHIQEKNDSGCSVIDVGCGNGRLINVLEKAFPNTIGIDPMKSQYDLVNQNIIETDIEDYNGPKKDILVAVSVGCVYEDYNMVEKLLEQIERVTTHNATIVIGGDPGNTTRVITSLDKVYERTNTIWTSSEFVYAIYQKENK
jgi:SAM-dependent methyltransferase